MSNPTQPPSPNPCTLLTVDFNQGKLISKSVLDNRYWWTCNCCAGGFEYIPGQDNVKSIEYIATIYVGPVPVRICEECIRQLNLALEET